MQTCSDGTTKELFGSSLISGVTVFHQYRHRMKAKLDNCVNFLSAKPVIRGLYMCFLAFSSTHLIGDLSIDYFVCSSAFTVCASDSQEDKHHLYLQIITFLKNLFFASTQPSQVGFCNVIEISLLGSFLMLWKKYKLCHKDIEAFG